MTYYTISEPEPAEDETVETIENIPESTPTNENETESEKTEEPRITPDVSLH